MSATTPHRRALGGGRPGFAALAWPPAVAGVPAEQRQEEEGKRKPSIAGQGGSPTRGRLAVAARLGLGAALLDHRAALLVLLILLLNQPDERLAAAAQLLQCGAAWGGGRGVRHSAARSKPAKQISRARRAGKQLPGRAPTAGVRDLKNQSKRKRQWLRISAFSSSHAPYPSLCIMHTCRNGRGWGWLVGEGRIVGLDRWADGTVPRRWHALRPAAAAPPSKLGLRDLNPPSTPSPPPPTRKRSSSSVYALPLAWPYWIFSSCRPGTG